MMSASLAEPTGPRSLSGSGLGTLGLRVNNDIYTLGSYIMAKGFGQFAQMQEALKKAKQVQQNATRLQDELAETTVEGSAAGGLIKITMTGNQEPLSLSIDPEALKEEREVLEDLILTAFKDAYTRSTDMMRNKMNELTGGISVPGLF